MMGFVLLVMCIAATVKVLARQRPSAPNSIIDRAHIWQHPRLPPKRDYSEITATVLKRIDEQRSEAAAAAAASATVAEATAADAIPVEALPPHRQRLAASFATSI